MINYQWKNGSSEKTWRNVRAVGYNFKINDMLYGNVFLPNKYGKEL